MNWIFFLLTMVTLNFYSIYDSMINWITYLTLLLVLDLFELFWSVGKGIFWLHVLEWDNVELTYHLFQIKSKLVVWHPDVATQMCISSEDDHTPVIQLWDLRYATSPLKVFENHTRFVALLILVSTELSDTLQNITYFFAIACFSVYFYTLYFKMEYSGLQRYFEYGMVSTWFRLVAKLW